MNEFPPLQKREGGRIRLWEIILDSPSESRATLFTRSGFLDGKIRETKPIIFERSKQKSAYELARTHAKTRWAAKKRSGYQERVTQKFVSKNNRKKQISAFVHPMSALLLERNERKLRFPLYVQAKLDGFRGMARKEQRTKRVQIVSRRGLPFPHLDIIKKQLESFPLLEKAGVYLDGELYLHQKSVFDIKRVLGRKTINSSEMINLERDIRFVLFDWFDKNNLAKPFQQRWKELEKAFKYWNVSNKDRRVQLDLTYLVRSMPELEKKRDFLLRNGYEGIVVRHLDGVYRPGKRSPDVFRSKEFKRGVFKIKGATEGRGDDKGTVIWILECLNDKRKTFLARPIGTREQRREWYKNRKKYIGKDLSVKYMTLDSRTGCVSRFPIGVRIMS